MLIGGRSRRHEVDELGFWGFLFWDSMGLGKKSFLSRCADYFQLMIGSVDINLVLVDIGLVVVDIDFVCVGTDLTLEKRQ
jgi:hypothetical protein